MKPALLALALLLAGCADPAETTPELPAEPTPDDAAPAATSALALDVALPERTRDGAVVAQITVSSPALVTVDVADGQEQDVNRTWNAAIALTPGRNVINITADDGRSTETAQFVVVREVSGMVVIQYNNYPGQSDSRDEVWIDPDALASASMYAAQGADHPGFANVHDLLVAWEDQTGNAITYGWSESFGFSISDINGAGNPVTASAPPWWCYGVEGRDSVLGITLEPFEPGMVVTWDLGTCSG